jgi:hypothetical protein
MPESSVDPLTLQFLDWVSSRRRTYTEAMEAWQTTCPRHTVWEDALIEGFIRVESQGYQSEVILTPRGIAMLAKCSTEWTSGGPNVPSRS